MRLPQAPTDSPVEVEKLAALEKLYLNEVDRFRTYSFHHILAVCSAQHKESTYQLFQDEAQVRQLISTQTPKNEQGYRKPVYAGSESVENKFFILCNGLMDVDFVVDSYATNLVVQPGRVSTGSQALTSLQGEIIIHEPMGVKFMNVYRNIAEELKVVSNDLRLIIKTVFIGELDDADGRVSKGQIGYVLSVPPAYVSITNFSVSVTEKGSIYTASLVNEIGGLGLNVALTTSSNGQLIRGDGNVRDMFNALALSYTEDAAENLKRLSPDVAEGKVSTEYEIRIDESIKRMGDWNVKGARNARQSGINGNQATVVPPNVSLDGAIAYILEACDEYLTQATSKTDENAFIYRIVPVLDTNSTTAKLIFKIEPQYINRNRTTAAKIMSQEDPETALLPSDEVLIYDYIFTGRNTDIQSFSMQIEEGSGYFASVTTIETYSDSTKKDITVTPGATTASTVGTAGSVSTVGKWGIVSPGTNSSQQRSADQKLTNKKEEYDAMLDYTWSVGAAKTAAILTTRGHTGWLKLFSINPYDIINNKQLVLTGIPSVYINILMPSSYTGGADLATSRNTPNKFERYWYKGLWTPVAVKNTFIDGIFTTELDLLAIPINPIVSTPKPQTVSGNESSSVEIVPNPPDSPFVNGSTNGKFTLSNVSRGTRLATDFTLGNLTVTKHGSIADNQPTSQDTLDNLANLANALQYIKDSLGIPITINSAYRCDKVNKAVGGATNSDHKLGIAADFTSTAMNPKQLVSAIISLGIPYKQIIAETPPGSAGWVHLSVSRSPAANKKSTLQWSGGKYTPYTA